MPKEVFYGPGTNANCSFEVRWGREGDVWVGDVKVLDREVDRLVKVLRKAQDQAYGPTLHIPEVGWIVLDRSQSLEAASHPYGFSFRENDYSGLIRYLEDHPEVQVYETRPPWGAPSPRFAGDRVD